MGSFNLLMRCFSVIALASGVLLTTAAFANTSLPDDVGTGIFEKCTFNDSNDEVICSAITNFNDQNYTINLTQPLRLTVQSDLTLPEGVTINPQQHPFSLHIAGNIQNNGRLIINGNITASTFTLNGNSSLITGNIQADTFTMNNGQIFGDINAASINLNSGSVSGSIRGSSVTNNSASIFGNVNANTLMNNSIINGNVGVFSSGLTSDLLVTNNGSGFIRSINSNGAVRNDGDIGTYINTPDFLGNKMPPLLCNTNPQDGNTTPCTDGAAAQSYCEGILEGIDYAVIGASGFSYSQNNFINGNRIREPKDGVTGTPTTPTPSGEIDTVVPGFAPLEVSFPTHMLGTTTVTEEENIPPGSYGTVRTVQGGGPPQNNLVSFSGSRSYDYSDTDNIYYIRRLELSGNRSRAVFGPGIYFINEVVATSQTYLDVAPEGRVIIHIGERFSSNNETYIHTSPDADTGNLVINLHPGVSFSVGKGNNGSSLFNFNGAIYSPYENTSINIANNNSIRGAILSSGTVQVGNNTTFDFSDEVRQQIVAAVGCEAAPGPVIERFYIEQPERLVSCKAAPIRITACANADCSERFHGATSATLEASSAVDWQGGTLLSQDDTHATVAFVNGQALVGMRNTGGGLIDLAITHSDPMVVLPTQCRTPGCTTEFLTSGLDVTTTPLSRAGDHVQTSIAALETAADGSCQPRLQNQTHPLRIALQCTDPGCAPNQHFALFNEEHNLIAKPLVFNDVSFDSQGQALLYHQYSDVGEFTLDAEVALDEVPSPDEPGINDPDMSLFGTSNAFYSTPYALTTFAYQNGTRFTALDEPFATAGEPFQLEIEATNAAGELTPSFGLESTQPQVSLTFISATQPDSGEALGSGDVDDEQLHLEDIRREFNNGRLLLNDVVWDEVGELNVHATLNSYFHWQASDNDSFFDSISSPESQLSRFVPAYFEVGLSAVINANARDPNDPSLPGCMETANFDFTYLGQPGADVHFEVLARNAKGALTRNYGAPYYESRALQQPTFELLSQTFGNQRLAYHLEPSGWVAGRFDAVAESFVFERATDLQPDGPFANEHLGIAIGQPDADGVVFRSTDIDRSGAQPMVPLDGALNLMYARLVLSDTSGNDYEPLPISGWVEAFTFAEHPLEPTDGEAPLFRPAVFDGCTTLARGQFNPLSGPDVNRLGNDSQLEQGRIGPDQFSWVLTEAFDGNNAELRFEYDITPQPWLGFPWRMEHLNESPEALAIFGQYRGNDRIIYWLERGF